MKKYTTEKSSNSPYARTQAKKANKKASESPTDSKTFAKKDDFKNDNSPVTNNLSVNITAKQVSQILGIHVRSAQEMLKTIREKLGKLKMAYVSLEEFCFETKLPKEDVLRSLESITPDPEIE